MRVPTADQKRKGAAEKPIMAYVKRPATESASRCMGAARDCAASTSRKMSAMTVASPARSDRTTMLPSQLTVPAVTCSPASRQNNAAPQRLQISKTNQKPWIYCCSMMYWGNGCSIQMQSKSAQSLFIHHDLNGVQTQQSLPCPQVSQLDICIQPRCSLWIPCYPRQCFVC